MPPIRRATRSTTQPTTTDRPAYVANRAPHARRSRGPSGPLFLCTRSAAAICAAQGLRVRAKRRYTATRDTVRLAVRFCTSVLHGEEPSWRLICGGLSGRAGLPTRHSHETSARPSALRLLLSIGRQRPRCRIEPVHHLLDPASRTRPYSYETTTGSKMTSGSVFPVEGAADESAEQQ